jgi:ATP-binding cassette subfamily B protein
MVRPNDAPARIKKATKIMMNKKKLPQYPLGFIYFFLKPYFLHTAIIILIIFLWAVNRAIEPYIIKVILDTLEINLPGENDLFSQLKYPILIFIALRFFMNIISRLHDYLYLKVMPNFDKNIIIRTTKYLEKHSHSYFQNHFGGSLVSKISTLADASKGILNDFLYSFALPFFSLIIITITMASVHYMLGIILLIWTIIFIIISYYLSLQIHDIAQELTEKSTTLIGKLLDSVTNILAVRLFGRRKYEISFLDSSAQEKAEKEKELGWSNLKLHTVMDIMANILIIILISFLIMGHQKGKTSIGDFTLVFTLGLSIIDIVWDISRHYLRFIENMGKSSQALKTILVPHAVKDAKNAQALKVKEGIIEFKDIDFSPEKNKPLFENLFIKIGAGEKIGIVGHSGSGKTTLLNLLVRLMDVDKGAILIDGQNIKEVTQDSLHNNISFIPQDPMLFHRTILENIKYGKLDASDAEVKDAAKKAFADSFIKALPQDYHTLLGERGSTLSGGQRQRLAIARAILKGAKILVLDEATSALDSETEHYIQESLENLMQNKTVIVIAHRLSTLLKMDRIIVLDQGKIIEQGAHKSLLRKKGVYYKFWKLQTLKYG